MLVEMIKIYLSNQFLLFGQWDKLLLKRNTHFGYVIVGNEGIHAGRYNQIWTKKITCCLEFWFILISLSHRGVQPFNWGARWEPKLCFSLIPFSSIFSFYSCVTSSFAYLRHSQVINKAISRLSNSCFPTEIFWCDYGKWDESLGWLSSHIWMCDLCATLGVSHNHCRAPLSPLKG